jgi:hypothetical protein
VPYFIMDKPARLDATNPTRSIIAGLATALGGLTPPTRRFSPLHHRLVDSHLWAIGEQPFGPYSRAMGLSPILRDMFIRNTVLSRIDLAATQINRALNHLRQFSLRYLYDPFGREIAYEFGAKGGLLEVVSWLAEDEEESDEANQVWREEEQSNAETPSKRKVPLPRATISRLYKELRRLEGLIAAITSHLEGSNLKEAFELSSSIVVGSTSFADYVDNELQEAETAMMCCYLLHEPTHLASTAYSIWAVTGVGLVVGLSLLCIGFALRKKTTSVGRRSRIF